MTPLARSLRNLLEKWLGRFYEGVEPPPRLAEEALAFERVNPTATPAEWLEFATRFAQNAYRDGYVRGLEWTERDTEHNHPDVDPLLLEAQQHDWSLAEAAPQLRELLEHDPSDPLAGVPKEARAAFFDDLGRAMGTHRVFVEEPDGVLPDREP